MDWWAWRGGCYVLCSGSRMLFSISIDLCGIYPASFQNNVSKVGPLPYSATFKALYSNLVMKACDSCIKLSWWSFIHSFIPIYKLQLSLELICSNYYTSWFAPDSYSKAVHIHDDCNLHIYCNEWDSDVPVHAGLQNHRKHCEVYI